MKGKQPLADHQAHSGLEELFDRSVLHDACAVGPRLCAVAAAAVLLPLAHAGCWCGRGCHRLARRSFARLPAHAGCRRGRRRRRRASRGFKRLGCILQERRLLPFGRGLALALLLLRHAAVRFELLMVFRVLRKIPTGRDDDEVAVPRHESAWRARRTTAERRSCDERCGSARRLPRLCARSSGNPRARVAPDACSICSRGRPCPFLCRIPRTLRAWRPAARSWVPGPPACVQVCAPACLHHPLLNVTEGVRE